jgi:hypothetical protein
MKNTKAQIPDEADFYRAIARAAERGDMELAATDSQPTPKNHLCPLALTGFERGSGTSTIDAVQVGCANRR